MSRRKKKHKHKNKKNRIDKKPEINHDVKQEMKHQLKPKKKQSIFIFFLKFFTVIIKLFLILVILLFGMLFYFNSPSNKSNLNITDQDGIRISGDGGYYFEVRSGETAQSVGLRLERIGLIKNRYFWNFLGRIEKEFIKSGTYKLDANSSQIAIYRHLVSGKQIVHRVTIKEGVTLNKIARLLEDTGVCLSEDFLNAARDPQIISHYKIPARSMEGYLFPDTYFLPVGFPPEQIIIMMADNFFKKIENIIPNALNIDQNELHEKVILASIVEREYRLAEEAPLIAGVFTNRLNINMGLQSCATVEYIITEILGRPHPRIITRQDLEIRNSYNTYMWTGLPPGPISVPGAVALTSAFFPANTQYFYFRVEDARIGKHYFSRTNDEHINAGQLVTKPQS